MKNIKTLGVSLAVITTISFNGCGSSSSGDSTPHEEGKKITGSITGNGYAKLDLFQKFMNGIITPAYAQDLNSPDKIVVMYDGAKAQKEFTINTDGSFEIDTSLLTKNDLVILVVRSSDKKVFGHLNLGTSSNNSLDYFDKSKLTDDLALGSIDTENNCTSDTTLSSTTSFSSDDLAKMEKIAISDNAMILYQNKYKSPNYDLGIHALYNMESVNDIKGAYSNINDFNTSNLIGLRPTLRTQLDGYDNIDETELGIYPPSNVNFTTARDGNFNQVANATTALSSNYSQNRENGNDDNWYEFGFCETFPNGDWKLKLNGSDEVKAKFGLNGAYPYDTNGKSIVPVAQIKLNMDESDNTKLKSIDVKWMVFNGSQYEQASEDTMNALATQDSESFPSKKEAPVRYWDGNTMQDVGRFESSTWNGSYTLSNSSSVTLPANARVNMNYYIGQVSYQFMFE